MNFEKTETQVWKIELLLTNKWTNSLGRKNKSTNGTNYIISLLGMKIVLVKLEKRVNNEKKKKKGLGLGLGLGTQGLGLGLGLGPKCLGLGLGLGPIGLGLGLGLGHAGLWQKLILSVFNLIN